MNSTENTHPDESKETSPPSTEPEQIEADIARHRADLARTVDELSDRLDFKKQAQEQIQVVKTDLTDKVNTLKARVEEADPAERAAIAAPVVSGLVGIGVLIAVIRKLRR